jgi:hypothetical protein
MQRASDFKVHLPITVLSTASLHAEAHFKFLPEQTHFNPYQKASEK